MAETTIEILIKAKNAATKVIREVNREFAQAKLAADKLSKTDLAKLNRDLQEASNILDEVSDVDVDGLQSGLNDSAESAETLVGQLAEVSKATVDNVVKEYKLLEKSIDNINTVAAEAQEALEKVNQLGKDIIKSTATSALFSAGTIKLAGDFSKVIGEVRTLIDDTAVSSESLREEVIDLSNEFSVNKTQVVSGFYQALSAGAEHGAEATALLETALKTAIGGVTDVNTAVDGLTTVINAFGFSFTEAETVADIMFTTMKNGKTTVGEISQNLAQVAPIASTLGVSFEDISATLIAMTLQGTKTNSAFTSMKAALTGLIRPGGDAEKAIQAAGFESAKAAIKVVGLQGAFNILAEAADGSEGKLVKMIGSTEGAGVIFQTTGEKAKFLDEALEQIANSAGATQAAFDKINEELGRSLDGLTTSTDNFLTTLGAGIGSAFKPFIEALTSIIQLGTELLLTFPLIGQVIGTFVGLILTVKIAFGALLIVGSTVVSMFLRWFILRTVGQIVTLFTGKIGILTTALSLLGKALTAVIGAGAVGKLKTAFVLLGVSALAAAAKVASFLKLTALARTLRTTAVGLRAVTSAATRAAGIWVTFKSGVAAALVAVKGLSVFMKATLIGAIIGTTIAIVRLANAYSDWRDAVAELERIQGGFQKRIDALKAEGVSLKANVKTSDELLNSSKKQIDAYQDQLLKTLELATITRALLSTQEDSAVEIAALDILIGNITKGIEDSVVAEKRFSDEAFTASIILQKTAEDAKALADAQREASTLSFDQNVTQLERVRDAQLAVLEITNELPAIADVFRSHNNTVAFLANQNADELISIAKKEQAQLLAIEEAGLKDSEDSIKEFARFQAELERETNEKILQINRDKFSRIDSLRNESFNRLKALTQQSIALSKQIADAELSGTQRIRELRRQGLTDIQAFNDKQKEISELTSKFNQALAQGDFDLAKQIANRQISLSGQLVGEIKKGEKVQLSKEASVQAAIRGTEGAQTRLVEALKAEKAVVDEAKASEKALFQELTTTLNNLDATLRRLAGDKIEFETKFKAPDAAEAKADVQKVTDEVSNSEAAKVSIGTTLNTEALALTKQELQTSLEQEQVDVLVQAAAEPADFLRVLREIETELATTGVDVSLVPVEDKFNAVKARILAEALIKDVQFNVDDAEVLSIIERLSQPSTSTHQFIVDNLSLKDSIEDIKRDTDSKHTIVANIEAALASINSVTQDTTAVLTVTANTTQAVSAIAILQQPTNSPHNVNANTSQAQSAINALQRTTFSTHVVKVVEQRAVGGLIGAVRGARAAIPHFAEGTARAIQGTVRGAGSGTSDSIFAKLSRGEFVIKAAAVKRYGQSLFQGLNSMRFGKERLPAFASGGGVGFSDIPAATPANNQNGATTTLNLSFNGGQTSTLTGSRDSVNLLVTSLQELQRGVVGG